MAAYTPFNPARGTGQMVVTSTTSAAFTIGKGNRSLRVTNPSAIAVYFVTYDSTVETARTATNKDTMVLSLQSIVIEKPLDHNMVAIVADSATPSIHMQPGEGGI